MVDAPKYFLDEEEGQEYWFTDRAGDGARRFFPVQIQNDDDKVDVTPLELWLSAIPSATVE